MKKISITLIAFFSINLLAQSINLEFNGFDQNIKKVLISDTKKHAFAANDLSFKYQIQPQSDDHYNIEIEIYKQNELVLNPRLIVKSNQSAQLNMDNVSLKLKLG